MRLMLEVQGWNKIWMLIFIHTVIHTVIQKFNPSMHNPKQGQAKVAALRCLSWTLISFSQE